MYAASHFLDHLQGFWLFFSQGFASFPQLDQLVETKVFIFGKLLPLVKGQWHHHMKFFLKILVILPKSLCASWATLNSHLATFPFCWNLQFDDDRRCEKEPFIAVRLLVEYISFVQVFIGHSFAHLLLIIYLLFLCTHVTCHHVFLHALAACQWPPSTMHWWSWLNTP